MPRLYPAADIAGADPDLVPALVDDFSPTAIEERDGVVRVFFPTGDLRDAARAALAGRFHVEPIDVSDEDWARRSQADLQPVTVGRITIVPNLELRTENSEPATRSPLPGIAIAIPPSMGFGTGHHATTRLCLEALQRIDLAGKRVLDVGTGSGVLAIAAGRLGAREAIGLDVDADAIQSARENLTLNTGVDRVRVDVADLASTALPEADVVLANLTGALLVRSAARLIAAVAPSGRLVASGLQSHERDEVVDAFAPLNVEWEREEAAWVGLSMKKS